MRFLIMFENRWMEREMPIAQLFGLETEISKKVKSQLDLLAPADLGENKMLRLKK
jgi:hypothetical protein